VVTAVTDFGYCCCYTAAQLDAWVGAVENYRFENVVQRAEGKVRRSLAARPFQAALLEGVY
jgi:hypothetical protein